MSFTVKFGHRIFLILPDYVGNIELSFFCQVSNVQMKKNISEM